MGAAGKPQPRPTRPGSDIKKMEERENLWLGLAGWLVLCYSASITGDLASAPQFMGWYNNLEKPFFTPGDEIFRPVWTLLYSYALWISFATVLNGELWVLN